MEKLTIEGPGPLNEIGTPKVIDWTKPVRAKTGRPVHIYAIDHNLTKPVLGRHDDDTSAYAWTYDGLFQPGQTGILDLENVPEAA